MYYCFAQTITICTIDVEIVNTKRLIRNRNSRKDRQCNGQEFEDTKEVIKSRHSRKNRQYNGQRFADGNAVIRKNTSKKDRQHNGQKFSDTNAIRRRISNHQEYLVELIQQQLSINVIMIGTTSSGISNQLEDMYSPYTRYYWNFATYKWKVHNGKIEIISFVVNFRS